MTSSPVTCRTHISGRRTRRWASAGTATALMSSGVTNARPASTAWPRASWITASVPRGEAPTVTCGCARVAETSATTYASRSGCSCTLSSDSRMASSREASVTCAGAGGVEPRASRRRTISASPSASR